LIDGIDVEHACSGELSAGFSNIRLIRSWLDAKEAEFARRQDLLAATVGARPAADALAQGRKISRRTAERAAARAATLGETPEIARQLAKGNISGEHVDALTSAARSLDDDRRSELLDLDGELALMAASKTPEQFGRHVRKTIQLLSDDDGVERSEQQRDQAHLHSGMNDETGMGEIRGELHPDDFQKANRRIDAEIAALSKLDAYRGKTRAQLAAIALVNLICSNRTAARVPRRWRSISGSTHSTTSQVHRSSVNTSTAPPSPRKRCAAMRATPTSSPSSSTVTASRSMSDAPNASPPQHDAPHCVRCIARARSTDVTPASTAAKSITSKNGPNTQDPPTSNT
jgi:hypothetical protein